jgi:hypothetical protein
LLKKQPKNIYIQQQQQQQHCYFFFGVVSSSLRVLSDQENRHHVLFFFRFFPCYSRNHHQYAGASSTRPVQNPKKQEKKLGHILFFHVSFLFLDRKKYKEIKYPISGVV